MQCNPSEAHVYCTFPPDPMQFAGPLARIWQKIIAKESQVPGYRVNNSHPKAVAQYSFSVTLLSETLLSGSRYTEAIASSQGSTCSVT